MQSRPALAKPAFESFFEFIDQLHLDHMPKYTQTTINMSETTDHSEEHPADDANHDASETTTEPRDSNDAKSSILLITTYGKRFGSLVDRPERNRIWNCAGIPNPPRATRSTTTGLSKRFRTEVVRQPVAQAIVQQAVDQMAQDLHSALLEHDDTTDQPVVDGEQQHNRHMYAFYCEHGKHRSVSVAEHVAEQIRGTCYQAGVSVEVVHRDVHKNPTETKKRGRGKRSDQSLARI